MSATLIDGKAIAAAVRAGLRERVEKVRAARGTPPGLVVIRVGEDPASKIYVDAKKKAAAEAGLASWEIHLGDATTEAELVARLAAANQDPAVDGILVQLPLPPHLTVERVVSLVAPEKDVDGFHPENVGLLWRGTPRFVPCTPAGVMHLLVESGTPLKGRHAVVVGRSAIVGKPVAALLLAADATVTVCHRASPLAELVPQGDIVVAAAGKAGLVRPEWIRAGATVIDVGINRLPTGKVTGDVDPAAVERAGKLTPVPGGVGPMTIAMLLRNTVEAAERGLGGRRA